MIPTEYAVVRDPRNRPNKFWGEGHGTQYLYIPKGHARMQQFWCRCVIDFYKKNGLDFRLYKKLLKELYRKEYYERQGWKNFIFYVCLGHKVVECAPNTRVYHDTYSDPEHPKGEAVQIQLKGGDNNAR